VCIAHRVHPFLHDAANRLVSTDQTRPVLVPDVSPYRICNCRSPSTSCAEFVSEYQRPEHRERWDAVVTCFFLDTAKNPLDYIRNTSCQSLRVLTSFLSFIADSDIPPDAAREQAPSPIVSSQERVSGSTRDRCCGTRAGTRRTTACSLRRRSFCKLANFLDFSCSSSRGFLQTFRTAGEWGLRH
jgi:hypothetical protein